ncbi:peptide chain release factor N(5)-glutamine methyltransferase [Mycoplasmopsis gallinacea]|uniref:peptide chain release factor N(5)-glutamine methyltransferase n=1 Tax=Mycoplasmopsis gallinacea TaxID=29556 RepID=A0A6H0V360_9BACT|nr:peptide chain release factor N(5)-glutamine methyltransferase [Mycoplasmopsis gallinacea]QIW61916.1 peptide chain release factor N(5)-glutamine methyltransferase [Mycoplasmopsis gallinacea]
MPTKEDLLLEKKRYGLSQEVSSEELKMLSENTPVQKIIGYVDYLDVKIDLSKKVLIPRYETIELVLWANEIIKKNNYQRVLDLCTGSGFIALAIKKANLSINVSASDIDLEAIEQTKINADKNDLKISIIASDLFNSLQGNKFDLIVSNPPYLASYEHLDQSVLKHEPLHALFASDEGLYFYKQILEQAPNYLNPNGTLLFEINPLHLAFWESLEKAKYDVEIKKDLFGMYRMVKIQFK